MEKKKIIADYLRDKMLTLLDERYYLNEDMVERLNDKDGEYYKRIDGSHLQTILRYETEFIRNIINIIYEIEEIEEEKL